MRHFCTDYGKILVGTRGASRGGVNAKIARKLMDRLNGVIHSRNLYICQPLGKRRVYNCEIKTVQKVSRLTVEDIYTGERYDVASNKFEDGYGKEVLL